MIFHTPLGVGISHSEIRQLPSAGLPNRQSRQLPIGRAIFKSRTSTDQNSIDLIKKERKLQSSFLKEFPKDRKITPPKRKPYIEDYTNKKLYCRRGTARRAVSVEILSAAAQLYIITFEKACSG